MDVFLVADFLLGRWGGVFDFVRVGVDGFGGLWVLCGAVYMAL